MGVVDAIFESFLTAKANVFNVEISFTTVTKGVVDLLPLPDTDPDTDTVPVPNPDPDTDTDPDIDTNPDTDTVPDTDLDMAGCFEFCNMFVSYLLIKFIVSRDRKSVV